MLACRAGRRRFAWTARCCPRSVAGTVGRDRHGIEERNDVVGMSLTDTAISKIKEMILDGRLAPGSKLSREADLAEDLGISRNSLRETVRALSLIRILDVRQGDGT